MSWQPMRMLERQSPKNSGDMVINQHLDNCVKMFLTHILVAGSQSSMEIQACKYGSFNFSLKIDHKGVQKGDH